MDFITARAGDLISTDYGATVTSRRIQSLACGASLLCAVAVSSCSVPSSAPGVPATTSSKQLPATTAPTPVLSSPAAPSTTVSPYPSIAVPRPSTAGTVGPHIMAGVTWHPTGAMVGHTSVTDVAHLGSSRISLLWIDARALKFRFIPGYVVPENSPSTASDNSASWVNAMAAAFNGGFMLSDHSGGYYYDGRLVQKMEPGFATLTVTKQGSMSISSWAGGERIPTVDAAVRQNLKLMIVNSVIQPNVPRRRPAWGWPLTTPRRVQARPHAVRALLRRAEVSCVDRRCDVLESAPSSLNESTGSSGVHVAAAAAGDHQASTQRPTAAATSSNAPSPPDTTSTPATTARDSSSPRSSCSGYEPSDTH